MSRARNGRGHAEELNHEGTKDTKAMTLSDEDKEQLAALRMVAMKQLTNWMVMLESDTGHQPRIVSLAKKAAESIEWADQHLNGEPQKTIDERLVTECFGFGIDFWAVKGLIQLRPRDHYGTATLDVLTQCLFKSDSDDEHIELLRGQIHNAVDREMNVSD